MLSFYIKVYLLLACGAWPSSLVEEVPYRRPNRAIPHGLRLRQHQPIRVIIQIINWFFQEQKSSFSNCRKLKNWTVKIELDTNWIQYNSICVSRSYTRQGRCGGSERVWVILIGQTVNISFVVLFSFFFNQTYKPKEKVDATGNGKESKKEN